MTHDGYVVAEIEDFLEVVAGVDVEQWERERARPKRLLGQPQDDAAILAAGKEERRLRALRRDLAEDVNRFGFEPLQVVEAGGGCAVYDDAHASYNGETALPWEGEPIGYTHYT